MSIKFFSQGSVRNGTNRTDIIRPTPSSVVAPQRFSRNGLILNYNPGDPASYPGSGTTINDLSTNLATGTLDGTISYSSSNGGVFALTETISTGGRITVTSNDSDIKSRQVQLTMCGWFRVTRVDKDYQVVVGQYLNTSSGNLIKLVRIDLNAFRYFFTSTGGYQYFQHAQNIVANAWTFWAVAITGSGTTVNELRLRLNETTSVWTTGFQTLATPNSSVGVAFGGNISGGPANEFFGGNLGEIAFYNRPLSNAELDTIYASTRAKYGV